MSDLERSMRKRLSNLPMLPPMMTQSRQHTLPRLAEDGDESDDSDGNQSENTFIVADESVKGSDYRDGYFDERRDVATSSGTHSVYLLHPKNLKTQDGDHKPLYFVFHHGAGSSGLSIGCVAEAIRALTSGTDDAVGVVAIDAVHHGLTKVDDDSNFHLGRMCDDVSSCLAGIWSKRDMPDLILVGHSMGGAVMAEAAQRGANSLPLSGLVIIDVVEGSAVDAFHAMEQYLQSQPKSFASIPQAIGWHLESGSLRNAKSAALSVPSLLTPVQDGADSRYTWRTDISATRPFWSDWFKGLSSKFLQAPCAKLLLLAGTDRLDTELIIGQMQGKFQLVVLPDVGHYVHEDDPIKTAEVLLDFYRRNDRYRRDQLNLEIAKKKQQLSSTT